MPLYNPFKYITAVFNAPLTFAKNATSNPSSGWMGNALVSSQANGLYVIPAAKVGSDALIFLGLKALVVGSEAVPQMVVSSVNPGVGFVATTAGSWSLLNSYTLQFFVINRTTR